MRQKFLTRLLLCLVPTVLAGVFVALAFSREAEGQPGFRRGIDLAGGTILVYEVNLERTLKARTPEARAAAAAEGRAGAAEGLTSDEIKRLAENIKSRVDPGDLKNIVVRPSGNSRIEIIIPFSARGVNSKAQANTSDSAQEVKEKVRQVGVLEFRIVANGVDDRDAIKDATDLLDRARTDANFKAQLEDLGRRGLPPPPPPGSYTVTVNGEGQDNTTYAWVALSREERSSYGLSNIHAPAAGGTPKEDEGRYARFEAVRKEDGGALTKAGRVVTNPARRNQRAGENYVQPEELFFTREFTKENPSESEKGKAVEYFVLTRLSESDAFRVDRSMSLKASSGTSGLEPALDFSFNAVGGARFSKISERNHADAATQVQRKLAIVIDEEVISAPSLPARPIGERGQISGGFDQGSVNRLVYILKSGALNAELKPDPVSENSVGPTLGQDTIRKGLMAVGLSFAAVLAFMCGYYRFAGVVACVALFLNLLLTVGFMVFVNAAFTLPGLAGIVLMLGMAVDANVLIYERIREEREKGANLATAIRLGYDRAFGTIIDTHLTSIFTCIVLYVLGNDNLKGFSISLTVGLIISLFTALYVTRLIFDFWMHKRWLTSLKMMRLFARPNFDFMKIRNQMFLLTAGLTLAGATLCAFRGSSMLNVDFTQGTAYGGRLVEGQERALTDTEGRKGFLTLLGEPAQRERLQVKDAVWRKRESDLPEEARRSGADYVYEIVYADDARVVVTFANPPEGDDESSQKADVIARASRLPGFSVEQVFLSGDAFGANRSRSFTVRTTEKEPELVQVGLDRLLRDEPNGPPLLATTKVTREEPAGPNGVVLTLDRAASPRYFAGFLERELKLLNRWPTVGGSAGLDVTGVPADGVNPSAEEAKSGLYTKLKVSVASSSEFRALRENTDPAAVAKEKADFTQALSKARAAFEARPLPDRLETFDPALAADTRNKASLAIVVSWLAILVYLWLRFGNWTFGLATVFCLIHDLFFTLGAVALCHYLYDNPFGSLLQLHDFKIDLAAVAALLTLVGYSVTDTIVVFDRIREVRGKNPVLTPQMINDSVNQTLSRTVLASLTVFLVVGVLYFFGGEGVHLFAFVMVVGVLVGTYSSIYIASPLLLIFGEGQAKPEVRVVGKQPTTTGV